MPGSNSKAADGTEPTFLAAKRVWEFRKSAAAARKGRQGTEYQSLAENEVKQATAAPEEVEPLALFNSIKMLARLDPQNPVLPFALDVLDRILQREGEFIGFDRKMYLQIKKKTAK